MIAYPLGSSGQTLLFTDSVLAYFTRHRQLLSRSKEAGGQLFARFAGNTIWIERATGPRPSDQRGFTIFVPNRLAERREIKRLFKKGLHYVGDWHTHPEAQPHPSQIDIESVCDMFQKSRHELAHFVMVVVGSDPFVIGLYVAICDGNTLRSLSPEGDDIR